MVNSVSKISSTLSFLLKKENISEAELSRIVDIPRATINRLVSGKTPDPRSSTLNAIAEHFNVNVDQLIGKQPLFLNDKKRVVANKQISIPIMSYRKVRDWQTAINKHQQDNHLEWLTIDASIEDGKFAVHIKGESMWPQFQDNTLLIISPNKVPKNKDYVLVYIKQHDEVFFRQLIVEGRYKFLKAVNVIFPILELSDVDEIIGVVIQARNNFF